MAGVVSPSMWVFEVRDPGSGRSAFCSLNEGLGKVLRYGAYSPDVVDTAALDVGRARPAAADRGAATCVAPGPVDIKSIVAQMLQMGDEGHNRNRAGTMMLVRELVPELLDLTGPDAPPRRRWPRWCGSATATTTSSSTS